MPPTGDWLNKLLYGCLIEYIQLLPRWRSGKEAACQRRRRRWHRFDPWVREIPWRRKWHPTPVFLPGQSHVQRSLLGYSPWGCKKSDMTECLAHTHTHSDARKKTMNFTFFSSAHGTFSRIDHILGHKASLGKFKKIEIIPSIFFWPQCSKIRSQLQEKNY